jgi:hypothetical protein
MAKKNSAAEPFWKDLVEVYFTFCQEKFYVDPSFDGGSPKALKSILATMKKQAASKGVEWTLDISQKCLRRFLEYAFLDSWLSENFMLTILNSHKDKIFFKIESAREQKKTYEQKLEERRLNYKPINQD